MKKLIKLISIMLLLIAAPQSFAQLVIGLEAPRKTFALGEPVILRLTVSNISDQSVNLSNVPGRSWLNFTISCSSKPSGLSPIARPKFPSLIVNPGQSKSFDLDIRPFYSIERDDRYYTTATVIMPDGQNTVSSARTGFTVTSGASLKSYNIVNKGKKLQIHARLITIAGQDCIFGQVVDSTTRHAVGACFMGHYLNFMTPIFRLDSKQNMHILCQSTPKLFTYSAISPTGRRVSYQLYKRTGIMDLISTGAGLRVVGGVPYNKSNASKPKYRSASERPF